MTREVLLPELAESVVEGEILKWLVQEGDTIVLEQPLCEVMTDKVTVELPSPYAGRLEKVLAPEGSVVAVHSPIALIGEEVVAPAISPPPPVPTSIGAGRASAQAEPEARREEELEELDTSLFKAEAGEGLFRLSPLQRLQQDGPAGVAVAAPATRPPARVLAVPAARQLARELGVDIAGVTGSGPGGRVRPLDVHEFARGQRPSARPTDSPSSGRNPGPAVAPVQYRTPPGHEELERRVPLRGVRRAISDQLQASHLYTVRTLTVDEADLTRLVALRARLNASLEGQGQRLSYLPFIFKAIVAGLKRHPSLNTSLDEASGEVVFKSYYHLGMAVAAEAGLVVPVIRDADRKSLLELGRESRDLAERARGGGLRPDEMRGSSFSVTNIGSVGALFSFPIINVPDAAILGVHTIKRRPIVDEGGDIRAADMMYLSLSFDHRLVDGADAARFCREVIRLLEDPELLLASG